jgi:bacterioferritin-associated ferredoxin
MAVNKLKNAPESIEVEVTLHGRDRLVLSLQVNEGVVVDAQLRGSGCTAFLSLLKTWRSQFQGVLKDLPTPQGIDHSSMLLREAILRAQGTWELNYPYKEDELCHCRAVPTKKVDAAIVGGCLTGAMVSRETSAGTSCGACRTDTDKIISYRKGLQK